MGMFDYIKVEMDLPSEPAPPKCEWFQTKDTPSQFMEKFILRKDGRLFQPGIQYEDRSDPTKEGIYRLIGMLTSVPAPELDKVWDDFHGDLEFHEYDDKTKQYWSYLARFTNGVCWRIILADYHEYNKDSA